MASYPIKMALVVVVWEASEAWAAPRVPSSTASLSSTTTITISSKTLITVVLRVCFKLGDVVGGQIQLVIFLIISEF